MEKRQKLINLFIERNNKINLSAIREEKEIYKKHILDSIELNKILNFKKNKECIDIGTGGGFPLLPLAITNKNTKFIGIDARKKKTIAVNDIINNLGLKNVDVNRIRSEDLKKQFDYITVRAVAYANKLFPQITHLIKNGGIIILYKLKSFEERNDIIKLCKKYNFIIIKEHNYKIFKNDIEKTIYIIKKLTNI